jgi:hypothetical protein
MKRPPSRLKRPRNPMPGFVRKALVEQGLMEAYRNARRIRKMTISAGLPARNLNKPG